MMPNSTLAVLQPYHITLNNSFFTCEDESTAHVMYLSQPSVKHTITALPVLHARYSHGHVTRCALVWTGVQIPVIFWY